VTNVMKAASVGVGGLTLGGGISHHTNEYGLACDNIASYEVVTASGKIVVASEKEYPDLYWALRGGGNNFGIVVTFNYETFPQGLMFASKRTYNGTAIPALIDAFVDAVAGAEQDTRLAHFLAVAYNAGMHFASTEFEYTRPVDPANPPAILKEYLGVLPLQEKTQNTTLANTTYGLTESMPAGFRTTMWSQSFKVDALLMQRMSDEFFRVAPCIPGFAPSIAFQAFSVPALRAMQKKGGNALGLSPAQGPLFHALFYVSWTDAKDDEAIMKAAKEYMSRAVDIGRELGKGNDYVYMPYSSPYQAVVDGYGSANVERLKAIAEKYDPTGVWRKLQPGGFKLEGAPLGTAVP
jgi:FAD/FMN-containing dehydrogenase